METDVASLMHVSTNEKLTLSMGPVNNYDMSYNMSILVAK